MAKLRIVAAEDDEGILRQMVQVLGTEFEVVDAVTDGRSLLAAAIALKPDVIVSDVYMPLINGPQVMQNLVARGYNFPFVFTSTDLDFIGLCGTSFVSKMDLHDELVTAVRVAAAGQTYISPRVRSRPYL